MNTIKYDEFPCLNIDEKIEYICKFDYRYFFNKSNVEGVGFSYKITNGFNTFKKCIQVCVSKKISNVNIKSEDLIPQYFKGIETDVVETGFFIGTSLTNRVRPVTGGYDIGPITAIPGGTYGCLVTDGENYFLLSNNHVLAEENVIQIGTPIVQPSVNYGGKDPNNIIASLSKFIPLESQTAPTTPVNIVDCAIARIGNPTLASRKITSIGKIKSVSRPSLSGKVQKVGAASELTKGVITSLNFNCILHVNNNSYFMEDQIKTTKMSDKGDSGSLLLDNNSNAIGLIIGAGESYTIANSILNVLGSLNVKIANG